VGATHEESPYPPASLNEHLMLGLLWLSGTRSAAGSVVDERSGDHAVARTVQTSSEPWLQIRAMSQLSLIFRESRRDHPCRSALPTVGRQERPRTDPFGARIVGSRPHPSLLRASPGPQTP
jgi:hypothetical protein